MDKTHNTSFDILRILAAFSVVILHVSSRYIMCSYVNDADFSAANFFDSVNRFGVPVFVMLSGALFLNTERELDLKRLWLHNILRIFVVFILWNYAYYVYQSVYLWNYDFVHQSVLRTITGIAYGTDHLWYLGMIVGLYAMAPVIQSWLKKTTKQNIEYFLLLFVAVSIIGKTIDLLLSSSLVSKLYGTFAPIELAGYLGYFVLGYYMTNYEVPKKLRIAIYSSVPLDIAINYMVSWNQCRETGGYTPGIYDCFGIFTFLEVIALFLFITQVCSKKQFKLRTAKFIQAVAKDTFGVYVMHVMVLDFLYTKDVFMIARPSVLFLLPLGIGIFVLCTAVSALLRRIPYVGRYLC